MKFIIHTRAIRRRFQTALIKAKERMVECILVPFDFDYNYED